MLGSHAAVFAAHISNPVERVRYAHAIVQLRPLKPHLSGRVLDFGASYGLSMLALAELGIRNTWGVEIDAERVSLGKALLTDVGMDPDRLTWTPDTRALPFLDGHFDAVLALAVFEHIPQPRDAYIREVWRVLRTGGWLVVAETPNPWFPVDIHTTGLPLIHWLPSRLAHRLALRFGRNPDWYRTPEKWAGSGWRGLSCFELVAPLNGLYKAKHEISRPRHRVLQALGLPSGLLDPYPVHVLQKL